MKNFWRRTGDRVQAVQPLPATPAETPRNVNELDILCEQYDAKYEMPPSADGKVVIRLTRPDGEVIGVRADSAKQAVDVLKARAARDWGTQ